MPCGVHTHYIHLSCIMLYVMIHTMLLAHHATGCIHGTYCTHDSILCYPHTPERLIAQFIMRFCTRDAQHLPEVILLLLFSPQSEEVSCSINSHFPRGAWIQLRESFIVTLSPVRISSWLSYVWLLLLWLLFTALQSLSCDNIFLSRDVVFFPKLQWKFAKELRVPRYLWYVGSVLVDRKDSENMRGPQNHEHAPLSAVVWLHGTQSVWHLHRYRAHMAWVLPCQKLIPHKWGHLLLTRKEVGPLCVSALWSSSAPGQCLH